MDNGQPSADTLGSAQSAETRSQLYRCFATAFSHPSDDFLDSAFSGDFLTALTRLGAQLPYPTPFQTPTETLVPKGMAKEDISVFFTTCFEAGHQAVSLREIAYSTLTETALLEDLLRFYQHFGLELSGGALRELPDSLPVELEFLHYLSYLEANARRTPSGNNNVAALQRAQRDFIDRHPGNWIRPFMLRLKSVPDNGFYASVADLLARFLESEQRFRPPADTSSPCS
jgi:DMSO reductase family type II enzyme chaperone